jgi:hypothetical protein
VNTTLESLELIRAPLLVDTCYLFKVHRLFLSPHQYGSQVLDGSHSKYVLTESCASAFRIDIEVMPSVERVT